MITGNESVYAKTANREFGDTPEYGETLQQRALREFMCALINIECTSNPDAVA